MSEEIRCEHCTGVVLGYATVYFDGKSYSVCHPNTGLDCYKLVTLYHHGSQCYCCREVRVTLDAQV